MKKLIKEPKAVDAINKLWQIDNVLRERDPNDLLREEISAVIHELQQMPKGTIEIYRALDGHRWTAYGDNGEIVGSGEDYVNKKDMLNTISKYYSTFKVVEKQKEKKA